MKNLKALLFIFLLLQIFSASAQEKKKIPAGASPKPVHKAVPKPVVPKDTFVEIRTEYGNIYLALFKETPLHRSNFIRMVKNRFYDSLLFHHVVKDLIIVSGDPGSRKADSNAVLGMGGVAYTIPSEKQERFFNRRGALGAPNEGKPPFESSGSQFYIVQGRKYTTEELNNLVNGVNYSIKMKILNDVMSRDTVKAHFDEYVLRGADKEREDYLRQLQPYIDSEYEKVSFRLSREAVSFYREQAGAPHLDRNFTVFGQVIAGIDVVDKIAAVAVNSNKRPLKDLKISARLVYR